MCGDHHLVDDLVRVTRPRIEVVGHLLPLLRQNAVQPPADRLIVVRAGIDDAVRIVAVRQVLRRPGRISRVKGKFEHLHIRESRVPDKLPHGIRHIAEILGDDRRFADRFPDRVKQLYPGSFFPVAARRGLILGRDGEEFVKSPEMIDPDDVKELAAFADAADPPVIPFRGMAVPVVERIAPQLPVRRKAVRRHAGDQTDPSALVEHKEVAMRPEVGAVMRDVDRDVADDPDALRSGIRSQRLPLLQELILDIFVKCDFPLQLLRPFCAGFFPVFRDIALPRLKISPAVRVLQSHEKCVVGEPVGIFLFENGKFRLFLIPASLEGFLKKRQAAAIQPAVIDLRRILPEIGPVTLFSGQKPLFDQLLKRDKIRISRKCRKGLIRRIPVSGRPDRQYLPAGHPCVCQIIHKPVCFLRKTADAVLPRQAEDRK